MHWTLHSAVQDRLQRLLGRKNAFTEHPFEEMGRIGDLYWRTQKIVFEIQVSPIHPLEVAARTEAYNRIGIGVVWILHDSLYNRRRLTGTELYLQGRLHYYTNIDRWGRGEFYDVAKQVHNGKVIAASPRFPVRLNRYMKFPHPHFERDHHFYGWTEHHFRKGEGMRSLVSSNPYRRLLDHLIREACAEADRG
ncbi:MAG: competence protein CoiA family protein [Parachlamydiales bacterium]